MTEQTLILLQRETEFLANLNRRFERSRSFQNRLKRSLTSSTFVQAKLRQELKTLLKDVPVYEVPVWNWVAVVAARHPQTIVEENFNFGESCGELHQAVTSIGVERQLKRLLTIEKFQDLQSPLLQMIQWMARHDIAIDYAQLIRDLCCWQHPARYIQDRWAQGFWQ